MEKNNFNEWNELFKDCWKVRMVENEHLIPICFLQMLSSINRVRYIYGGQYKNVNLSSFKVQASGTGKGVADKLVGDLLRYMGYKICKLQSFTEAAIIGSLNVDLAGKSHVVKGALGEYDFIWIDEARNLIVGNSWTTGLLEVINGYLDDGEIFKRLAKGEIKYMSSCNFGTGTFFFNKLKPTVMTTGIFQRCLFSYKIYSKEDVLRISRKYDELANKNYMGDLQPIFAELKKKKEELSFEKYNISKNPKYPNYVIKMDLEASKNFGEQIDKFFEEEIFDKIGDGRLKDILTSFLIRYKELGHKIMCLYAVWNGKDSIDNECGEVAVPIVKEQLGYVLEFMSDVFEGTKFDTEDLENENQKKKKISVTEGTIIKVIKQNPGITKTEFKDYYQKHRRQFKLGEQSVLWKLIPKMEDEGKIQTKVGEHNEHRMYIEEDDKR
jgi:hypothetical protein